MLGVSMYTTIETLYQRGLNKSEIARATNHNWRTVDKVIKAIDAGGHPKKKPHPNGLDIYKDKILEHMEHGLSAVRIHDLLQAEGCRLSYSSVKVYVSKLNGRKDICVRFHTKPGEEAQVDFGYVGMLPDPSGKIRKAWIFNMRLCYSRLDFYMIVYDQKVETFINCHVEAFRYFGGVPECVKIDNLKAAVLEANFYQPVYQWLYKECADYYGFQIVPCRVRKPQEKGKVESGIKYIKNNFFAGRKFNNVKELNKQLRFWLDNTCNSRVHGTTRKVPWELFKEKEKNKLRSLPLAEFKLPQVGTRKVQRDCHVYIDYNYYSVPYGFVGKEVEIKADNNLVKIFYESEQIALHTSLQGQGAFSTNEGHYPPYKQPFSSCNKKNLEDRMKQLGDKAHLLFLELLEKQPGHWYRTTQGILSLQKSFDSSTINLACGRAVAYGAIKYQQVKSICASGSYSLPICDKEVV